MLTYVLLLASLVLLPPGGCASQQPSTRTSCKRLGNEAGRFIEALPGTWKGRAVRTPIGTLPYDLSFDEAVGASVKGRSNTNGQAVHTWSFRAARDTTVWLDFHSTFGNSHAKGLCVVEATAEGWRFAGGQPDILDVRVRSTARTWEADIWLGGKPHVSISAGRP